MDEEKYLKLVVSVCIKDTRLISSSTTLWLEHMILKASVFNIVDGCNDVQSDHTLVNGSIVKCISSYSKEVQATFQWIV